MCSRYAITSTAEAYKEEFGLKIDITQNHNIFPGSTIPIITSTASKKKWGLHVGKYKVINLRSESVENKLENLRPCLIPADGFYEWKTIPHYFQSETKKPFSMAGLYNDEGCAILTCEPNDIVAPIHDRMPVIIPKDKREEWLQTKLDVLIPLPSQHLILNQKDNKLLKGQQTL